MGEDVFPSCSDGRSDIAVAIYREVERRGGDTRLGLRVVSRGVKQADVAGVGHAEFGSALRIPFPDPSDSGYVERERTGLGVTANGRDSNGGSHRVRDRTDPC